MTVNVVTLTAPNGQEFSREDVAREAREVEPSGVTLPRPWEEYRAEAEFAEHRRLVEAVEVSLSDLTLTPQRYAEVMSLLDGWYIEDRDAYRRDAVQTLCRRRA